MDKRFEPGETVRVWDGQQGKMGKVVDFDGKNLVVQHEDGSHAKFSKTASDQSFAGAGIEPRSVSVSATSATGRKVMIEDR